MRVLLFLLVCVLGAPPAAAQPVGTNLNVGAWLRQAQALGDNASETAQRRLALRLDPNLRQACEGDEIDGGVSVMRVDAANYFVTLQCGMGARRPIVVPYAVQHVAGRWRARRLQVQTFYGGRLGTDATLMGDLEVRGQRIGLFEGMGASEYLSFTYRLPRIGEPAHLVLLRAEEGEVDGPSRVTYSWPAGQ